MGIFQSVWTYRVKKLTVYPILQTAKWGSVDSFSQLAYSMVNMLLLSHLGIAAISAVSAVLIVQLFCYVFDGAINEVARSLIGQSTSEKKKELPESLEKQKKLVDSCDQETLLVQTVSINVVVLTVILGILVGGLAVAFPVQILQFSGTEKAVAVYGAAYFQIVGGCFGLTFLVSAMKSIFQGTKQMGISATSGVMGNITHVVAGSLGVYLLGFGLEGVAWATILGRMVEIVFLLYKLRKGVFARKLEFAGSIWEVQKYLLKKAFPKMENMLIYRVSMGVFWHILQGYGEVTLPAKRISDTISDIAFAFLAGLGAATNYHVSKSYGNGDFSLIKRYTWSTIKFVAGVVVVVGTILILTGERIASFFFSNNTQVVELTGTWIIVQMFNELVSLPTMIVSESLNGVQATKIFRKSGRWSNFAFLASLWIAHLLGASLLTVMILDSGFWFMQMAILTRYFYSGGWELPKKTK
ncbi:MATE family efflux transporter [Shimazuella soli]|uniref:MATE family efflux transporter n=1 Tax=Shimazuella soli TaxID=1892854 RepID=UPI001F10FC14|nr:MATE family efflux transporter [Shimazuella soli]